MDSRKQDSSAFAALGCFVLLGLIAACGGQASEPPEGGTTPTAVAGTSSPAAEPGAGNTGVAAAGSSLDSPDAVDDAGVLPAFATEPWTGDLSGMRQRQIIRALVTPSRTDFFIDGGRPLGTMAEFLQRYEEFLNTGISRREMQTRIAYIPVPFDELLPALLAGRGDIAAATLTITPERERQAAFATGGRMQVDEIVVAAQQVTGLDGLDQLAGRTVYVLRGSSYVEHLKELNDRFAGRGLQPVTIVEADRNLQTEDILELVNAGIVELTVSDDYKARLWAEVLPAITVRNDLKVHTGGRLGWAVRRDSPELMESLQAFSSKVRKGTTFGNVVFKRYYEDTRWIKNPVAEAERARLVEFAGLFEKYGDLYGFDWLALSAQAYQESGLDHSVRSRAGAVGIMQLLPTTAADPNVGIADIHVLENNIHAGAKYLAFLRDRYFNQEGLTDEDRLAFTWAAYNAGPARLRQMRSRAKSMGLDPDRWFGQVEHAALAMVGQETVRYVANIYKYYVAYTLEEDLRHRKATARESVAEVSSR